MRRYRSKLSWLDFVSTLAGLFVPRPSPFQVSPEVITIIDGDTFYIANTRYRIASIDAPEIIAPRCEHERKLGLAAKAELMAIIRNAQVVEIRPAKRDHYGRTLAHVIVDGRDIVEHVTGSAVLKPVRATRPTWCSCGSAGIAANAE